MGKYNFNINNKSFIIYDSADAWGNGKHETTKFMLEFISKIDIEGKTVIDIGTGTGILSVLCGKLGAKHILALDIKPVTLEWTRKNFKRNDIVAETEVHDCTISIDEKADIVLANLPPAEQYENMKHIINSLNDDGYLIISWYKEIPFSYPQFEIITYKEGISYDVYLLKKK